MRMSDVFSRHKELKTGDKFTLDWHSWQRHAFERERHTRALPNSPSPLSIKRCWAFGRAPSLRTAASAVLLAAAPEDSTPTSVN